MFCDELPIAICSEDTQRDVKQSVRGVSMPWEEHLRDLNVSELLELQMAITRTLQRRLAGQEDMLHDEEEQEEERELIIRNRDTEDGITVKSEIKDSILSVDSEELILTQWEKSDLLPQDASSPLKVVDDASLARIVDVKLEEDHNENYIAGGKENIRYTGRIKQNHPEKAFSTISFNMNPITSKPWILEDFKPNRDLANVKRGRKRLQQFCNDIEQNFVKNNTSQHKNSTESQPNKSKRFKKNNQFQDGDTPEFDNLRDRSPSPPGFGRMDFPTTQERQQDKLQSQMIIYEKTLYRFHCATNGRIPQYEREFLFKKPELNELVDRQQIVWSSKELKVFTRNKSAR